LTIQVQSRSFFLKGKRTEGHSTEIHELRNPARAEIIGRVPRATTDDVNEAVEVAREAFGGYKDSGIGNENGMQAVSHYTRIKSVKVNSS
jgi:acyl-CoA reductase-like NAD-dependent aldehyde dehydrogenase